MIVSLAISPTPKIFPRMFTITSGSNWVCLFLWATLTLAQENTEKGEKTLINQHVVAGCICPLSSPYASPSFIIPKVDLTVQPQHDEFIFQTLVHLDHIKYTATLTPFRLWEWVVMPMGLRNSPATHQWCVTLVLSGLIEKVCHIYLDDIIIWLSSLQNTTSTLLKY